MKKLYVLGGGTISHIRNHLALCAPAFGSTARALYDLCDQRFQSMDRYLMLTRMADPTSKIVTNDDVKLQIEGLKGDPDTKIIFFNMAMCDWDAQVGIAANSKEYSIKSGKYAERLKTSDPYKILMLTPAEKIISMVKDGREDIFVVGFKTTCGATEEEQYEAGYNLWKNTSVNMVLANDTRTRMNIIIPSDEGAVIKDRNVALTQLVDMTWYRSR